MAARDIVQAGHPALKSANKLVKDFQSGKLRKLIADMKDSQYKADLVGIAAPQIGENYAVFLTHPRNTPLRNVGKEDICRVYINPTIVWQSPETVLIYEGCGSLPDIFGPVIRANEVTVEAYDEEGKKFALTADGLLSRVIQHEVDHLNGYEFIERVSDYHKVLMKEYYVEKIKSSNEQKDASEIKKIEYKKL